jgi:hypothetical protein
MTSVSTREALAIEHLSIGVDPKDADSEGGYAYYGYDHYRDYQKTEE